MTHKNINKSQRTVNLNNKNTEPNNTSPAWVYLRKYWPWIFIIMVILFVGLIRLRLLQIPLERDEGEFAYMGQLMLQGIPPYLLAYNMKLPGIYAIYALIMAVFGQTIYGIHLGLMFANAIAIMLLFILMHRLFGNIAAVVAVIALHFCLLVPLLRGLPRMQHNSLFPFN